MTYTVLYDIHREPPFSPETAWLAAGVCALGLAWALVQRRRKRSARAGYLLIAMGALIALFGIGMMSWDHQRLVSAIARGEAKVVEGPVQSLSTERVLTVGKSKEYRTYQRFFVGSAVWFGYFWQIEQAGFHNQTEPRVPLADGMLVRATYLFADGDDQPPRIVKLETPR